MHADPVLCSPLAPSPLPLMYFGEVMNVLWMRRGDRDRGSLPPLSDAKNIRLKLSFVRSSVRSGDDRAEREMLMMMMTPRDKSTGRCDNDHASKVSREVGWNVTIKVFHPCSLHLALLLRNLAMIRRFSRLTFRHSLARSPALDTLFCQSRMATLRLTD